MFEDFGWSGDEFLMGDCQMDWLDAQADVWEEQRQAQRDFESSQEWEDADVWVDNPEDCPMDGDVESALASCGWGTDEDYGMFSDEPFYNDW